MILVDWQIDTLAKRYDLLLPYDEQLLNPASIDVRVGDTLLAETADAWRHVDLTNYDEENPFWLQPNAFVLVSTRETFNLPDNIAAEFRIKSSRAREGYTNALAVWCDPGWTGSKLTMELKNYRQHTSLPLYPGLKIGQMIFHVCHSVPDKTYKETGRYNNDATVQESKG